MKIFYQEGALTGFTVGMAYAGLTWFPHVTKLLRVREVCLIWLLILIGHLFLIGMWLSVSPTTDAKKTCL